MKNLVVSDEEIVALRAALYVYNMKILSEIAEISAPLKDRLAPYVHTIDVLSDKVKELQQVTPVRRPPRALDPFPEDEIPF